MKFKDDRFKDITNGVGLGLFSIFWGGIVAATIFKIDEYDPLELVRVLSLIAVSAGVYVAIWVHYSNVIWRRSEAYLDKCEELFEKAYTTFTSQLDEKGRPLNDRKLWLNTARLIQAAQLLSKKIEEPSVKEIYIEIEQYWRGRFYDILKPSTDLYPEEYFAESPETFIAYSDRNREPLAARSLAAMYRFIKWPNYAKDPLDDLSAFTDEEIDKFRTFGPRGLGRLLNRVKQLGDNP